MTWIGGDERGGIRTVPQQPRNPFSRGRMAYGQVKKSASLPGSGHMGSVVKEMKDADDKMRCSINDMASVDRAMPVLFFLCWSCYTTGI